MESSYVMEKLLVRGRGLYGEGLTLTVLHVVTQHSLYRRTKSSCQYQKPPERSTIHRRLTSSTQSRPSGSSSLYLRAPPSNESSCPGASKEHQPLLSTPPQKRAQSNASTLFRNSSVPSSYAAITARRFTRSTGSMPAFSISLRIRIRCLFGFEGAGGGSLSSRRVSMLG